jgi:hypothetical protein
MAGNVTSSDIETMISARLANLKRLYAKDGKMARYHKIKELEVIIGKIKELKNARGFEPNNKVLPAHHTGGVSGRHREFQVVVPAGAAHP